jgi:hypothetical protein
MDAGASGEDAPPRGAAGSEIRICAEDGDAKDKAASTADNRRRSKVTRQFYFVAIVSGGPEGPTARSA